MSGSEYCFIILPLLYVQPYTVIGPLRWLEQPAKPYLALICQLEKLKTNPLVVKLLQVPGTALSVITPIRVTSLTLFLIHSGSGLGSALSS